MRVFRRSPDIDAKANQCLSSGLPPYHPLVISQGYSGDAVNTALRNDAANVMKAGYNLRGM